MILLVVLLSKYLLVLLSKYLLILLFTDIINYLLFLSLKHTHTTLFLTKGCTSIIPLQPL